MRTKAAEYSAKYRAKKIKEIGIDAWRKQVAESTRKSNKKNKSKKAESNKRWDEKNRNKYQREYNKKNGITFKSKQ